MSNTGKYNTYVGARYVPIFAGDWDVTKNYEPLVIVSYQGNSYTSKTFVPANTPITNESYWALTGNYNAQVEYYRQEVQEIKNSFENTLDVNNVSIKGEIDGLIVAKNSNTHGQGDTAANVSICNSKRKANINGNTLSDFIGYSKVDSVVNSTQMELAKDLLSTGKQYSVYNVNNVEVILNSTLDPEYIVKGGVILLFTSDPSTHNSDLSDCYIGIMTGTYSTDVKSIQVENWYVCGDTTLTPVSPTNITHAVVGFKNGQYLRIDDIYINSDTPDYIVPNGGEINLWDYKGKDITLRDIVLRHLSSAGGVIGVAVRNMTERINGTIGFLARNVTSALFAQNVTYPIRVDGSKGSVYPLDGDGLPNNNYTKAGVDVILSNGNNITLPTGDIDRIFDVLNNSGTVITLTGTIVVHGLDKSNLSLVSYGHARLYYSSSTGKFYYLGGSIVDAIPSGSWGGFMQIVSSGSVDSLFPNGVIGILCNATGSTITITTAGEFISDGGSVNSYDIPAFSHVLLYKVTSTTSRIIK